ncbi:MAG: hypothetical protein PHT07_10610 [Paludibacter sp.]|nr:hypothetical protein [Paludibacter sp.]
MENGKEKLGRVLLYVFVVARQKNTSNQMNIAQQYVSFKKDGDGDTTIVSFDSPGIPIWVETISNVSAKQSIYFVSIVIPENFWDEPDVLVDRIINKTSSEALNSILNLSFDTYNTIMLDTALDSCPILDDRVVFRRKQDFEVIKIQKNQTPKR